MNKFITRNLRWRAVVVIAVFLVDQGFLSERITFNDHQGSNILHKVIGGEENGKVKMESILIPFGPLIADRLPLVNPDPKKL